MRGGIDESHRAELIKHFDLDPHQESTHLIEKQLAKGFTDLNPFLHESDYCFWTSQETIWNR